MVWNFVFQLLIAVALQVVSYLLMPKPKTSQSGATQDMDNPTAEAGRPIPVLFGTATINGLNVLWFGEKRADSYSTKGDTKKDSEFGRSGSWVNT